MNMASIEIESLYSAFYRVNCGIVGAILVHLSHYIIISLQNEGKTMSAPRCLRKVKNLMMGTLKTALTYGEPDENVTQLDLDDRKSIDQLREPSSSKASTSYNGLVSSMEFFVFVVTVSSVTTISSYMSNEVSDTTAAQLVLFVLMCCGLVTMFLFGMFRDAITVDGRHRNRDVPMRDRLNLYGITLFYVLACVLDMFYTLALLSCGVHWTRCPYEVFSYYVVSCLFHIFRIVYLGSETLFCIVFQCATFTSKSFVRYGLMLMQAVNIALWFEVLLNESVDRIRTQKMFNFTDQCLDNEANASQRYLDCIHQNTTVYKLLQNYVCPNFYPFSIEFSLLVGDCLASWLVQSGNTEAPEARDQQNNGYQPLEGLSDSPSSENTRTSIYYDGREVVEDSRLLPSLHPSHSSSLVISKIFLLVSLVLNLLFCILSLLPKLMKHTPSSDPYKQVFFLYGIFYFLSLLLLVVFGYCISMSFRPKKWRPLEGLEYLLLVSAIGPFAYEFFSFVAIVSLGNRMSSTAFEESFTITPSTFIALELIHTIEIYLQIPFQLYISRVDFGVSHPRSAAKRMYLKAVLFHFATSNIGLWAVNSFTGTYNVTKVFIQSQYFGESQWLAMNNIILPLTLFFRFTSFLHFTRAYSSA